MRAFDLLKRVLRPVTRRMGVKFFPLLIFDLPVSSVGEVDPSSGDLVFRQLQEGDYEGFEGFLSKHKQSDMLDCWSGDWLVFGAFHADSLKGVFWTRKKPFPQAISGTQIEFGEGDGLVYFVFVDPSFRNGGVGTHIQRFGISQLGKRGVNRVLGMVNTYNLSICRSIKKIGYRPFMIRYVVTFWNFRFEIKRKRDWI